MELAGSVHRKAYQVRIRGAYGSSSVDKSRCNAFRRSADGLFIHEKFCDVDSTRDVN